MPGTVVFRPIEAKLTKFGGSLDNADSFCSFTQGNQKIQGDVCQKGGSHPHWNEAITVQVGSQPTVVGEVQNKEWTDDNIGTFEVNMSELESKGRVERWYPISHGSEYAGEILVESSFTPESSIAQSIQHEKSHQGNIPSGLDQDRYRLQHLFRENEPRPEIAETNEFGDYQPFKSQPFGFGRDYTSGMMEHGQYYSGQQTSYGEAYPMAHKSVGSDNFGSREDVGKRLAGRQDNPLDYALYMNQAFEPHEVKVTGNKITSVVEKAYLTAKSDEQIAKKHLRLTNPNPAGVDKSYLSAIHSNQATKNVEPTYKGGSLDQLDEHNTSIASTAMSENPSRNIVSLSKLDQ